ncbi:MAG: PLP-dependent aminotransferase family protein [Candidatus Obscuribacterales bacterium]|nr:PLP-dependent aminotransferase family protein [Steroidobacteraceae bacterium]
MIGRIVSILFMQWQISSRAQRLTSSAIREILKVTERPEVISFAGGLPSPATFPIARIAAACSQILSIDPHAALQYGPTEGYFPLREWIAARCRQNGADVVAANVLITTGSQQALDLIAKVLIEPGRNLLVETPTYLGALQAFSLFEPRFVAVPCDEHGPLPSEVAEAAKEQASFFYLLPNFQNPSGRRIPLQRRIELIAAAKQRDLLLIEDDPYGELSYGGEKLPSLLSMHPQGVIYTGSFSKILAPGLRVGFVVAPEPVYRKLVQAKQAADLHTPSFTQRIVYEVVQNDFLEAHIPVIRDLYANQCKAMLAALQQYFPKQAQWNTPAGGMFIWVTLPKKIDSAELLQKAIARNVAFVPGAPFFAETPEHNTLRLSFVTVPVEKIEAGIKILGELITAELLA